MQEIGEPRRFVEFLCAREDNTWDTFDCEVPHDVDALEWAQQKFAHHAEFQDVCMWAVYHDHLTDPIEDAVDAALSSQEYEEYDGEVN